MKNKTSRRKRKNQYGGNLQGLSGIMGSSGFPGVQGIMGSMLGGAGATGAPVGATQSQPSTIDIKHASEIAAKELIQKICHALNPPDSQAFLNIATNSLKTYLEGEDANKMMNEQMKGFIETILDGILNNNQQSPIVFRETFKTYLDHIKNTILLPAIMKEIGNGREIQPPEIEDLVNKIESNILQKNIQ